MPNSAFLTSSVAAAYYSSPIYGLPFVTVGPTGSSGTNYGPFTPGTTTNGFQEAEQALTGGGTIVALPGVYGTQAAPVFVGNSNINFVFSAGAILSLPANDNWASPVVPTGSRMPMFILQNCSNITVKGGQFTQVTGGSSVLGTVWCVANNVTNVCISGGTYTNITDFPILTTCYYNGTTGAVTEITSAFNTFTNCGNTVTPDGGGVRFGNQSSGAVVLSKVRSVHDTITNPGCFGIDVQNGTATAGQITDVLIDHPIVVMTAAVLPQRIGVYIEKPVASATWGTNNVTVVEPHVTGGYHCMMVEGGTTYVDIQGGVCTGSWRSPLMLQAPNAGTTLSHVTVSGGHYLDGGQSGSTSDAGIEIGSIVSTDAGTISDITIEGVHCTDDQTSKTQAYGIGFINTVAGSLTIQNVTVLSGDCIGNKTASIKFNATSGTVSSVNVVGWVLGYNPVGMLTAPFVASSNSVGIPGGGAASPVSATTYTVRGALLYITGAATTSITVTDAASNTIFVGTAITAYPLYPGYTITAVGSMSSWSTIAA